MTSEGRSVRERLNEGVTAFENPEISAMAVICRILEDLPDEAARLRVMRWSFSKFGGEFHHHPLGDAQPAPSPTARENAVLKMPRAVGPRSAEEAAADFNRQVAELKDFFER